MDWLYDIKNILFWFIYSINYLVLIFWIIFFICFYLLLFYLFNIKEEKNIVKEIEYIGDFKEKIKEKIKKLEENYKFMSEKDFYNESLEIIKDIIYNQFNDKKVYNLTLSEIKNNYEIKFINFFEYLYIQNFTQTKENNEIKIIKEIKNALEI